jgi:hypothetical protein
LYAGDEWSKGNRLLPGKVNKTHNKGKRMKTCSTKLTQVMLMAAGVLVAAPFANATNLWWVKGGNWADARDNYNSGWVIPCGLTSSETVAGAQAKADQIASNIKYAGGNMVRVPINPPTIAGSYWTIYQAFINELVKDGLYVDMCCWTSATSVGTVTNLSQWETMWETVDSVYKNNSSIFYEPINEPYGYSTSGLQSLYANDFLPHVAKSQGRILLGGTGYEDHLAGIGSDSALSGCDLALHIYPFWDTSYDTVGDWETALNNRIGGYQSRATITEMGAPATTGLNYKSSSSNVDICFIQGVSEEVYNLQIGLVYWPMWKDGDSYRLFVNTDNGEWTNWSLMTELQAWWGN